MFVSCLISGRARSSKNKEGITQARIDQLKMLLRKVEDVNSKHHLETDDVGKLLYLKFPWGGKENLKGQYPNVKVLYVFQVLRRHKLHEYRPFVGIHCSSRLFS